MWVTLETARLVLRPFETSDLDDLISIHEHPEVAPLIGARVGDRTGAWRMLAMLIGHWHLRGYGHWAVVDKGTGQLIGRVGLWYPDGWPDIEVGWVIRRSEWGRGFATEAAREAVAFAFDELGLAHVISLIGADNRRSIRVAEKIGETLERVDVVDGARVLVYGIHASVDGR